jgi:hypothetical protein
MFRTTRLLMIAVAFGCLFAEPANARQRVRTTNTLSGVTSKIILNYQNSGQDICTVYNGNNRPVIVYAKVYPAGWPPNTWGTAGPAYIGVFELDTRFFGWISGPQSTSEQCLITSVQLQ